MIEWNISKTEKIKQHALLQLGKQTWKCRRNKETEKKTNNKLCYFIKLKKKLQQNIHNRIKEDKSL